MQYFKHLSTMRHDRKIKNLIFKYGVKGYGLYCLILESIVEKICNEKPEPDLEESCEELARFFNEDTTEINEMANYMINQGLISLNEITCRIECHKIYKYLEQSQTRSEKLRKLIKSYKDSQEVLSEMSVTVCDKSDRIEKKRIEKNRIDIEIEQEKNTIEQIINYLNKKAKTNYKATTPKTKSLINARIKEGFTVNDFKKVIDNKIFDWFDNAEMKKFVRPETLFGTKFEGYLNQDVKNNNQQDVDKNGIFIYDQTETWT